MKKKKNKMKMEKEGTVLKCVYRKEENFEEVRLLSR